VNNLGAIITLVLFTAVTAQAKPAPKLPIAKSDKAAISAFIAAKIKKEEAGHDPKELSIYEPTCRINNVRAENGGGTIVSLLACETNFSAADRWNGTAYTVFEIGENDQLTKVIYEGGEGSF
jgi:hypothetical protein